MQDGDALRRIGRSAEIFDDFTPLRIGADGRFAGVGFALVGRLQFGTDDGPWNEWHAAFDDGRSGWLSEDNGRYVFAFDAAPPADAPRPETLRAGTQARVAGRVWSVGSVVRATLLAAEGELPLPPPSDRAIAIADLRNADDEVATLEASGPAAPRWSVGRPVALADLKLSGLREAADKTLEARAAPCPNCGAALDIRLDTTQSVVCGACKSVVDLSGGIGPDMAHFAQDNPHEPALPLGATGQLAVAVGGATLPWQIVGYMERIELTGTGDVREAWREYLLHHRMEGFAFLVDANAGWSVVRTLAGAPQERGGQAVWAGTTYRRRWTYASTVTYALGEFYWRVEKGQRTEHQDYEAAGRGGRALLNLERTPREATWSAGGSIPAAAVAAAFGLPGPVAARIERAGPPPLPAVLGGFRLPWLTLLLLLIAVVALLAMCSRDACGDERRAFGSGSAEYRQCRARSSAGTGPYVGTGGAWGGYSSGGGGHK
ncbi:MAG: DUF4178 domain-containing protein [Burkholderiaceae bacterium]